MTTEKKERNVMRFQRLLLFVLTIIFVLAIANEARAAGVLWLGTKRLPAQFLVEVVKGNVPGHELRHRFGKAIVGTTMVPIASSLKYPTPTAAVTLEVVSSDADDTAAGAGARSITIKGLNASWQEITQTVATNGLTPVPFPIDMLRVYDWWVETSGTYATSAAGSHQGTITIQTSPGAVLWFNGTITPYPKGQSEIAGFTVPVGVRAYIFIHGIIADSTKTTDVIFLKREDADTIAAPFPPIRTIKEFTGVAGNSVGGDTMAPINAFAAKTDILFMGIVASGTASITVDYEILLISDNY